MHASYQGSLQQSTSIEISILLGKPRTWNLFCHSKFKVRINLLLLFCKPFLFAQHVVYIQEMHASYHGSLQQSTSIKISIFFSGNREPGICFAIRSSKSGIISCFSFFNPLGFVCRCSNSEFLRNKPPLYYALYPFVCVAGLQKNTAPFLIIRTCLLI
jgi:hypothetical protein